VSWVDSSPPLPQAATSVAASASEPPSILRRETTPRRGSDARRESVTPLDGLFERSPTLAPGRALQIIKIVQAVNVDRALQMVNLVLEGLSEQPFRIRDADFLAVGVACLDGHFLLPENPAPVARNGEAPFFKEVLTLRLDDLGVYQHVQLVLVGLDDRNLQRHADLRRGQPDPRRIAHGLDHVLDERPDRGVEPRDPACLVSQNWIPERHNGPDRHRCVLLLAPSVLTEECTSRSDRARVTNRSRGGC